MAAPLLDTSVVKTSPLGTGNISTLTWSHTVSNAPGTLLVAVATDVNASSSFATVSSLTASPSLTFVKRGAISHYPINSGSRSGNLELWAAPIASTGTYSITANVSQTAEIMCAISTNFYQICDTTAYWDTNASLPATAFNENTVLNTNFVTISTDQADDHLVSFIWSRAQTPSTTGFTKRTDIDNIFGSTIFDLVFCDLSVSATQTNLGITTNNGSSVSDGGALIIVDAITNGTGGVCPIRGAAFQTFVTIICS